MCALSRCVASSRPVLEFVVMGFTGIVLNVQNRLKLIHGFLLNISPQTSLSRIETTLKRKFVSSTATAINWANSLLPSLVTLEESTFPGIRKTIKVKRYIQEDMTSTVVQDQLEEKMGENKRGEGDETIKCFEIDPFHFTQFYGKVFALSPSV